MLRASPTDWALRFGATDFVNPNDFPNKRIQDVCAQRERASHGWAVLTGELRGCPSVTASASSRRTGADRDDRRRPGLHVRVRGQRRDHACGAGGVPSRVGPEHHHRRRAVGYRDLNAPVPAGDGYAGGAGRGSCRHTGLIRKGGGGRPTRARACGLQGVYGKAPRSVACAAARSCRASSPST